MGPCFKFDEIYKSPIIKSTLRILFGSEALEIIERPASFLIRLRDNEPEEKIKRLVILPPRGFTANEVNWTNSHAEVRRAKAIIKGGIRPEKKGFNLISNVITFAYYTKREIRTDENQPYVRIDPKNCYYREIIKSSNEEFFVVKENGEGFYHNLINRSDEWVTIILEKELRLQKKFNFAEKIKLLKTDQQVIFNAFFEAVQTNGDAVYTKNINLVNQVVNFDTDKITPLLIEALNIVDTGKHEACAFYAMILKFGKRENRKVLCHLNEALANKDAPAYYLKELIQKLNDLKKTEKKYHSLSRIKIIQ